MTAFDMIREGFGVWADGALGTNMYTTPIVFTLLFLFGFLATAVLKTFSVQRTAVTSSPDILSAEGRELIDDANTARLFELEAEVTVSKDALNRFTETLSTTFAHLSGGLAIFDADKSLYLFNPALSDLLDLDPVWLAKRPSIADFISMLREKRHLPEKKNFLEWRRLLTDLKDTGQQKSYDDEWVLPDGRIFHVTGQPHPRGAVAFLFEDISAQVAIERQHRLELSLNKNVLNGLSDGVVVVNPSGVVKFANAALGDIFGVKFRESLVSHGISDLLESTCILSDTADFWPKLKAYVAAPNRLASWEQRLTVEGTAKILADVSTLPDGFTLVVFKAEPKVAGEGLPVMAGVSDPILFANLISMLSQREILLDHSRFDIDCLDHEDTVKTRRILWYLVISAANCCRKDGKVVLSSCVEGQCTSLSCHVSDADYAKGAQENVAGNLLKSLAAQSDERNSWEYDAEVDPYTVSFRAQKRMKLSVC